ncbi:predicted protein [Histoplasma capsulatum G186AR]|uniref:Uncharacterized protein n=1 Tax=Ajellomyces capsulatus (strain G186AR / H82 / ATCC MYA-2454 / RMSCC 2432) TaxID=447093 RepID=C0NPU7_AJECG|nr:uncharacterized protein HCBG_05177 [Histoplasma capsulatum G186AR]EEH06957.1 predicted protein [Histoplasma capsulatum G186AR]
MADTLGYVSAPSSPPGDFQPHPLWETVPQTLDVLFFGDDVQQRSGAFIGLLHLNADICRYNKKHGHEENFGILDLDFFDDWSERFEANPSSFELISQYTHQLSERGYPESWAPLVEGVDDYQYLDQHNDGQNYSGEDLDDYGPRYRNNSQGGAMCNQNQLVNSRGHSDVSGLPNDLVGQFQGVNIVDDTLAEYGIPPRGTVLAWNESGSTGYQVFVAYEANGVYTARLEPGRFHYFDIDTTPCIVKTQRGKFRSHRSEPWYFNRSHIKDLGLLAVYVDEHTTDPIGSLSPAAKPRYYPRCYLQVLYTDNHVGYEPREKLGQLLGLNEMQLAIFIYDRFKKQEERYQQALDEARDEDPPLLGDNTHWRNRERRGQARLQMDPFAAPSPLEYPRRRPPAYQNQDDDDYHLPPLRDRITTLSPEPDASYQFQHGRMTRNRRLPAQQHQEFSPLVQQHQRSDQMRSTSLPLPFQQQTPGQTRNRTLPQPVQHQRQRQRRSCMTRDISLPTYQDEEVPLSDKKHKSAKAIPTAKTESDKKWNSAPTGPAASNKNHQSSPASPATPRNVRPDQNAPSITPKGDKAASKHIKSDRKYSCTSSIAHGNSSSSISPARTASSANEREFLNAEAHTSTKQLTKSASNSETSECKFFPSTTSCSN